MQENINVTIRLDKELKEQADLFLQNIGMSLSTAVNVFLRQSINKGKIPFEIEQSNLDKYEATKKLFGLTKDNPIGSHNIREARNEEVIKEYGSL